MIDCYERGLFADGIMRICPELIEGFRALWSALVVTKHQCLLSLPFYHMGSEPFWVLLARPGYAVRLEDKSAMRSLRQLSAACVGARIAPDLHVLLGNTAFREEARAVLLSTYLGVGPTAVAGLDVEDALAGLVREFCAEDAEAYTSRLRDLKRRVSRAAFEEEVVVRHALFSREVRRLYGDRCAVSKSVVFAPDAGVMVNACHIVPFADSMDDRLVNGIAFSPTIHRAFDLGLIGVDDDYQVVVHGALREDGDSAFCLSQFAGERIVLPEDVRFFPSPKGFALHRERFGL